MKIGILTGGGDVPGGDEAPGGFPQVAQDVDEVDEERHVHAAFCCFGAECRYLVVVAVDQADPLPPVQDCGGPL